MKPARDCVHLLDDSDVPGYQLRCLVCGRYWVRGPRTSRIEPDNSLRVVVEEGYQGHEAGDWADHPWLWR